jgi:hypothetical protein
MTLAHRCMDVFLWVIAFLWLCHVIADFSRAPPPRKRNRRLPAPSPLCERSGTFEVQMNQLTRRQAD